MSCTPTKYDWGDDFFFCEEGWGEWSHIGINTVDRRYLDFGYLE